MNFETAKTLVSFVVDDAGSALPFGESQHATVRKKSVILGWQCGFEVMFVSVHSYLDVEITDEEAICYASDYLSEIKWFSDDQNPSEPEYILRKDAPDVPHVLDYQPDQDDEIGEVVKIFHTVELSDGTTTDLDFSPYYRATTNDIALVNEFAKRHRRLPTKKDNGGKNFRAGDLEKLLED